MSLNHAVFTESSHLGKWLTVKDTVIKASLLLSEFLLFTWKLSYLPVLFGLYKTGFYLFILFMHGLVHDYKRPPNNVSASRSLLPRIILLKFSILNVSSSCTYPSRKAHVLLSSLEIIVFINLATDVRNLSPYHGRTCLIYSPDRGLAGGEGGADMKPRCLSPCLP